MTSTESQQDRMNNKMDGLEKARNLAIELGTEGPPQLNELCELQIPNNIGISGALTGVSAATRVWDSGATSGMTRPGSTPGQVVSGRWARVATGAGVVKTNQWVDEDLSWGKVRHIGLGKTTNTLSAGQHNAELGVQTSWLEPEQPGLLSQCGPCLILKPAGGHITWSGQHQVQIPRINGRTPEITDDQPIHTISRTYCATAGCECG